MKGIFIAFKANNPEYNNIIEDILIYILLLILLFKEGRAIATIKIRILKKIIILNRSMIN
jgi:hypothetical protein